MDAFANAPAAARCATRAVEALLDSQALAGFATPNLGGEDFGFYLERLPGTFLPVGAREPGGEVIPVLSPRFHTAEESLFVGAAVLAETARIAAQDAAPLPTLLLIHGWEGRGSGLSSSRFVAPVSG